MKFQYAIQILFIAGILATGCSDSGTGPAFNAFQAAFDRQEAAIRILENHRETPDQAIQLLEALRTQNGDAIHLFREEKSALKKELSEAQSQQLEQRRTALFEELNAVLAGYPASKMTTLRHLILTL